MIRSNSFPDKNLAAKYYSHKLADLSQVAGLDKELKNDPMISADWAVVAKWEAESRYQIGKTERDARDLYQAIESGVLPWIRARW